MTGKVWIHTFHTAIAKNTKLSQAKYMPEIPCHKINKMPCHKIRANKSFSFHLTSLFPYGRIPSDNAMIE